MSTFKDICTRTHKSIIHIMQFLRLWILQLYEQNSDIPVITSDTIIIALRVLTNTTTRGRKFNDDNTQLFNTLTIFYNKVYKNLGYDTKTIDGINLSRIFDYVANMLETNINNNIIANFHKYVSSYVQSTFKKYHDDLIEKCTQENKPSIKKNIKSELKKMCYDILNNINNKNIVFTCHERYHKWITDKLPCIMPVLPEKFKNYSELLKHLPQTFLPCMIYMMNGIETNGHKKLQFFPLKTSYVLNYVPIDTLTLIDIFHMSNSSEMTKNIDKYKDIIWNRIFNMDHPVFKKAKCVFNYMISTDCKGVSINFITDKQNQIKGIIKEYTTKTRNEDKMACKDLTKEESDIYRQKMKEQRKTSKDAEKLLKSRTSSLFNDINQYQNDKFKIVTKYIKKFNPMSQNLIKNGKIIKNKHYDDQLTNYINILSFYDKIHEYILGEEPTMNMRSAHADSLRYCIKYKNLVFDCNEPGFYKKICSRVKKEITLQKMFNDVSDKAIYKIIYRKLKAKINPVYDNHFNIIIRLRILQKQLSNNATDTTKNLLENINKYLKVKNKDTPKSKALCNTICDLMNELNLNLDMVYNKIIESESTIKRDNIINAIKTDILQIDTFERHRLISLYDRLKIHAQDCIYRTTDIINSNVQLTIKEKENRIDHLTKYITGYCKDYVYENHIAINNITNVTDDELSKRDPSYRMELFKHITDIVHCFDKDDNSNNKKFLVKNLIKYINDSYTKIAMELAKMEYMEPLEQYLYCRQLLKTDKIFGISVISYNPLLLNTFKYFKKNKKRNSDYNPFFIKEIEGKIKKKNGLFRYFDKLKGKEYDEFVNAKKLYIDPGKSRLLTVIDDNDIVLKYSNSERIKETKRLAYQDKRVNYKKRLGIEKLESTLSNTNSTSCSFKKFKDYVIAKNKLLDELFKKYNTKLFSQLKWYSYINTQRALDKMVNKIIKKYAPMKHKTRPEHMPIIIIGDWSQKYNLRNQLSTPLKSLQKKLASRFKIYYINEYNTSKLHHKIEDGKMIVSECENLYLRLEKKDRKKLLEQRKDRIKERQKKKYKKKHEKKDGMDVEKHTGTKGVKKKEKVDETKTALRKIHSVLTYPMQNGRGCINRDINAVKNMRMLVKYWIDHKDRPKEFKYSPKIKENVNTPSIED